MKTVITTTSFGTYDPAPLDHLDKAGISYTLNPHGRKVSADEVVALAADADGIIAGTESLSAAVLDKLPGLKVISRCGVGMDSVDLDAAAGRGIRVFNTPEGPTLAVAELAVALILDLLRMVSAMDRNLRQGIWKKQMGSLLTGKKIGIIGFGRIGKKVAELLEPFSVELMYCDVVPQTCTLSCGRKGLEEILGWADIICLHLSAQPECRPVIGAEELALLDHGAWLVNLSRGGVVDEEALYRALTTDRLAGAALDVFEQEPYAGQFTELPNVILTPHVGSYAREARIAMEMQAVENLIKGLTA